MGLKNARKKVEKKVGAFSSDESFDKLQQTWLDNLMYMSPEKDCSCVRKWRFNEVEPK